ncbi:phage integrase family protein [Mycobacteroides abscessus subsp. abscessus]|nr:phage integrase family protein [Mycobacteroides abscessus subsp. abscessus]SLC90128.1 phage integrase family protein [Mycobacteroides abscessus subsp. abscessus]
MTPAPKHPLVVSGISVSHDSLVIQARPVGAAATAPVSPRFGDPIWDLSDAIRDRHSARQAIHWDLYPPRFRQTARTYVFALVNIVEAPPHLFNARATAPGIKTIWSDLVYLRYFLRWLDEHEITSLSMVSSEDLDRYARYIQDFPGKSTGWRRRAFLAVQRLQAYRYELPKHDRLPEGPPWGGETAARLAKDSGPLSVNKTPRIAAPTMETLLSAALFTATTLASDLLPAASNLVTLRSLAQAVAQPLRCQPVRGSARYAASKQQLELLLSAMSERGIPLPGVINRGQCAVDAEGMAIAGWIDKDMFTRRGVKEQVAQACLPTDPNHLVIQRFSKLNNHAWRQRPMRAAELVSTVRHVITACFLVVAYLSGVRTGEALNLRRGCITRDEKLDLVFMSGTQLKSTSSRRTRSPSTVPWVVVPLVAEAVSVLEKLSVGEFLFPSGRFCSADWFNTTAERARTPGSINADLRSFVEWFNSSVAPAIRHPTIPVDADGPITAPRLRRTLAWHIVHRPGGLVAGAVQYGHVHTQIMQGYAGYADSGFTSEVQFESLLTQVQSLHDDAGRLASGEHVSGPAAPEYQSRLDTRPQFLGTTIPSRSQLNHLLANPSLSIHHGTFLTCVYRHESAACRSRRPSDKPEWGRCRLTCRNVAYTDRDIEAVEHEVGRLGALLSNDFLPQPLSERIKDRRDHLAAVISRHQESSEPIRRKNNGSGPQRARRTRSSN